MRRRVGWSILLFACACVLAASLFELGVRWFEPQPETPYQFSADTWYAPVPGARFVYRRQEFRVPVQYNNYGMRDVPRQWQRDAHSVRLALMGDSFAEALQVPLDSTLSQQLEERLCDCLPGRSAEVLNFGVSGFGTAATAARYKSLASRFRPDVVLYLFVANDVTDMLGGDARLYEVHGDALVLRRIELSRVQRLQRQVLDGAKRHLHAYRFLRYRLLRQSESERLQAARVRAAQANTTELLPGELAWQRFAQALAVLRAAVAADGARLLVVQATSFGPDMTARLTQICDAQGVARVDLVPTLAGTGDLTYRVDGHWRALGHAVAARTLAPTVCALARALEPASPGGR